MKGTMMGFPLTLHALLERAGQMFPTVEIVSRRPDCCLHRYTYADFYRRARSLAQALQNAGLRPGDRVATLMWNHYAHLEAYFGIPAAGGVLHTLNLRLHPSEIAFIVQHAGDRFLIVDDVLLPIYEQFKSQVQLQQVIVVHHGSAPASGEYADYETFISQPADSFQYPAAEEDDAAAMCYTSGTTGKPKGVVYSHRSIVLHSFGLGLADSTAISQRDVVMPMSNMFHANAWGLPHAAVMIGCKLVFPGPHLDPENVLELLEKEQVTVTGAVPTVWLNLLEALYRNPARWKFASGLRTLCAGTAPPESLIRRLDRFGIHLMHLWGMTETSPAATFTTLKRHMDVWPEDERYAVRAKQGLPLPFVELRLVNDAGVAPWDGATLGELQVRGPWVAASYYNCPEEAAKWTPDGWLRTGDIASIDPDGYLRIADRSKDLIKSGGEWISSADLENALVAHESVREAAVIAVPHPKWDERPIAVVVVQPEAKITAEDLKAFLSTKFSKWQLPDAFVFVEQLPHTSTGKLLKAELRKQYGDWNWAGK